MAALGQDAGCLQTLTQANEEFNAGRFFGIPSLLKGCIDNGFSDEQRFQAYYLLAQVYLILDDPIAAEDSYLKLLKSDPEYVATPDKDPIDLVYLSKKFTATPIFTPHLRIGGNVSIARLIHEINTEGYDVNRSNKLRPGFHFGAGVDWNLNDNLSISAEALLAFKTSKFVKTGISTDDTQEVTERQTWVDVPIYVKYRDNLGNVRPFGYAGFALNMLISARAELRTENISAGGSLVPTEGPNVQLAYKRNFLNRSFLLGGGAYYKIGKDFIFADLRYMAGMTNLTDTKENYYDKDGNLSTTISRYRWTGDYFRLDNLSLSIGYVKPLYNPRKIKRVKTKKVMRDISKEDN